MAIIEQTIRVPEERLGDLYRFLGELMIGNGGGGVDPPEPANGEWTMAKVAELWDRCGGERSRRFLQRVAEAAPNGLDAETLATDLGLENGAKSIAGISGAIGHASSAMGMRTVPWEWPNYKMSAPTAALVLKVASSR